MYLFDQNEEMWCLLNSFIGFQVLSQVVCVFFSCGCVRIISIVIYIDYISMYII